MWTAKQARNLGCLCFQINLYSWFIFMIHHHIISNHINHIISSFIIIAGQWISMHISSRNIFIPSDLVLLALFFSWLMHWDDDQNFKWFLGPWRQMNSLLSDSRCVKLEVFTRIQTRASQTEHLITDHPWSFGCCKQRFLRACRCRLEGSCGIPGCRLNK